MISAARAPLALLAAAAGLVATGCRERPPERQAAPLDSTPRVFATAEGATLLHLAARDGNRSQAESLLRVGYQVGAADHRGESPLHYAARAGHADLIELLLTRGADMNAQSPPEGVVTPLELAAEGGHLDAVRRLLDRGAAVTDEGPLDGARRGGHAAVVALLAPLSPAWARIASQDTMEFAEEENPEPDPVWDADAVMPLAYAGGDWWVAIAASQNDNADGEVTPCSYRRPWDGGTSDGGIWVERWRVTRRRPLPDSTRRLEHARLATPTHTAAECTPQTDVDRRYGAEVGALDGRLQPNALWNLSRSDTFSVAGTSPARLRYRIERDTSLDAGELSRDIALACFVAVGSSRERCVMIVTNYFPGMVNRATPVVAAVARDTLWLFGLRTYGRTLEPAWISQPVGVAPAFLGRLALRAAPR